MVRKRDVLSKNIRKSRITIFALERGRSVEHLINQDAQGPPVHRASVAAALDDFGGDVLFSADKGVGSEVGDA